jgi:hypothetical protein
MSKFEESIINNSNEKGSNPDKWEEFNESENFKATNIIIDGLVEKIVKNNEKISIKDEEVRAKEREINDIKGNCEKAGCASYLQNETLQSEKNKLEKELFDLKEIAKKLELEKSLFIEKN